MAESLLGATVRLTSAAEALAALAAHARVRAEGLTVDPVVGALLAEIATELIGSSELSPSDPHREAVGMARAFLQQASELVDDPARQRGWSTTDPTVLQGIGRISMAIAPVFAHAARHLAGLEDALARSTASFLDVGVGTGWLAIATARTFPAARVVGIDIFEPALALARRNIDVEQLNDRIEVRSLDVTALDVHGAFDAIWLPLPFLPKAAVATAIQRSAQALRPGGWLLPGTFVGADDRLSHLLTDLRIVRSGGHPWTAGELEALLAAAELVDAHEVARQWAAPVRLFAAQRPR